MTDRKRSARSLVDAITRDIQGGRFAPGAWLKQIDLERRYGCNRLEIRRSLDLLVQARLVEHLPNRGYYVFRADDRSAADIRDLRIILELAAVDGIVEQAGESDLQELRALAQRFDDLVCEGTVIQQYEANVAFHEALLSLHTNGELPRLVTALRARLSSAPAGQWRTRERIRQSSREHFAIVDALEAGDAEAMRRLIRAHILQ